LWSGLLPRLLSKVLVLEVVKVSRRGCGGWSCCRPRSLLTVKSVLLSVNNSNIDVSGKRGNRLSLPIVGDNLGNSPVTGSVPVQDCLRSSIPGCTDRSWAAIAAVSGLPEVAEAGGIGLPGAVHCAERVDILSSGAVKSTPGVDEPLGAVTGDGGTESWDLLVHSWIMLDTAGDVCPGPVILAQWNVVSTKITHDIARLARKGF